MPDKRLNASFAVLDDVLEKGAYSNLSLQKMWRHRSFDARDRAAITAAVYGVLSRLITLDFWLGKLCHQPLERIDPALRTCLRLGSWHLAYGQSSQRKPYALVNEICQLAKQHIHQGGVSFVNAVLRRLSSMLGDIDWWSRQNAVFSRKQQHLIYGLSSELYGLFKKWFGDEVSSVLSAFDMDQHTMLRWRGS